MHTLKYSARRLLLPTAIAGAILLVCFVISSIVSASILTYSDRISNSAPSEYSNHTLTFTTNVAIPAGGFVRFTPEASYFTIPAANFNHRNAELLVATSSGFIARAASSSASSVYDGVTVTSGTSGNVEITLNSTVGIPANAQVRMLIGNHTSRATSTDLGILNPSATNTYNYRITAGIGGSTSQSNGKLAIIESVHFGDVDTTETIPPFRFNGAPTGTLSGTTQSVEFSLRTNEFSRCRYSTVAGIAYFSMSSEFSQTLFTTIHSKVLAVTASSSYAFYIRCIDDEGNFNTDDYLISFNILPVPEGTPGDSGEEEGGGGSGTGGGTGSGSESSGSGGTGGGSTGGGSSSSGSSSGGSGGNGGFEGVNKAYQSGDGEVIINGYAFPNSRIVALVDGKIANEVTSTNDGRFSITLSQIARGAYSFGVYGIDKDGVKSSTFSTTFTITGSRSSVLSNINVMPSIKVTPDPVDPGGTITVRGYTIPNATVTIENQSDKTSVGLKSFTAVSGSNGAWSVQISTIGLVKGTYKVRAKAKQDGGVSTNFSGYTFYGVGEAKSTPGTSDLNRDGKVNLTDFSILLFWWNTNGGASNPPADINQDGRVSLTDFSIMIFNWTG